LIDILGGLDHDPKSRPSWPALFFLK